MKTQAFPIHNPDRSKTGKNDTILIVRVISMLMIIGCHLCSWFGINSLALILNVGVYTFLLISGMLYSAKTIVNAPVFIKGRWKKLCIPMYYLGLFLLIYNVFNCNIEAIRSVPTYLFNLQGIGFIIHGIDLPQMNGLGHLWFLSAIMICYVLLTAVKKKENRGSEGSPASITGLLLMLLFLDILFAYTMRVQLHYFIAFFLGYAFGRSRQTLSKRNYGILTLVMACAMIIRLLARRFLDGTITYNDLVVSFTHIVLAIWIYATIHFICQQMPELTKALAQSKAMNWLDESSIYLYMTHYMFLVGPFYISDLPCSVFVQLLVFLTGTLISAGTLRYISEKTFQKVGR